MSWWICARRTPPVQKHLRAATACSSGTALPLRHKRALLPLTNVKAAASTRSTLPSDWQKTFGLDRTLWALRATARGALTRAASISASSLIFVRYTIFVVMRFGAFFGFFSLVVRASFVVRVRGFGALKTLFAPLQASYRCFEPGDGARYRL